MHRKVCSIGNSRGGSIPPEFLEKLGMSVCSEVDIRLDETASKIIVEPARKKKYLKGIDRAFVSQVNDFIERYEPALKELSRK